MPETTPDSRVADAVAVQALDGAEAADLRPPGADEPADTSVREVILPRWRSVGISVGIVLAAAIILLVTLPRPRAGAVQTVDPAPAVAAAANSPELKIYLPKPLPAGWHADSAGFETSHGGPHLHIGYLAPDHGYVGLEEVYLPNYRKFVGMFSAGDVFHDMRTIDGLVWVHLLSDRKSQESLVWYGPHGIVMITGTSSLTNLEQLAASLHVGG